MFGSKEATAATENRSRLLFSFKYSMTFTQLNLVCVLQIKECSIYFLGIVPDKTIYQKIVNKLAPWDSTVL